MTISRPRLFIDGAIQNDPVLARQHRAEIAQSVHDLSDEVEGLGINITGTWDADTNTPTLQSGIGTVGETYIVTVAGNTNLDGEAGWVELDWALFGANDQWTRVPYGDVVVSFESRKGAVVSQVGDYTTLEVTSADAWGGGTSRASLDASKSAHDAHTGDFNNPHVVKSDQVNDGSAMGGPQVQDSLDTTRTELDARQKFFTHTAVQTGLSYNASVDELVLADPSAQEVKVNFPAAPAAGARIGVKCLSFSDFDVIVASPDKDIESIFPVFAPAQERKLWGIDAIVVWEFDPPQDRWIITEQNKALPYIETWLATPLTGISGAGDPVQFAHQPDRIAPIPLIATFASNVFTFSLSTVVQVQWELEWNFILSANNQDVQARMNHAFTGQGGIPIYDHSYPFAHARAGTFDADFNKSELSVVETGDTWGLTAVNAAGSSGTLDLQAMEVVFTVTAG